MPDTALILGGASGIGAASAHALAAAGLTVAIGDIAPGTAAASAAALGEGGHLGLDVDVADEAPVARCFDQVEAALGPVRVLVIAAGVPGLIDGKRPLVRDTTLASWDQVLGVNARGTFVALREMLRRRVAVPVVHGRIITVASIVAQMVPRNAPITYAASKGAVMVMTRVAAVEAAELGMTVNAVAPGVIDTPMLRAAFPPDATFPAGNAVLGTMGQPQDIAAAVEFLASERSCFINGACIDVNGGVVMR